MEILETTLCGAFWGARSLLRYLDNIQSVVRLSLGMSFDKTDPGFVEHLFVVFLKIRDYNGF